MEVTAKRLLILPGVLMTLTILAAMVLTSTNTSADETAVSNVSVGVPVSCNMTGTLDSAHTATINPGTYQADIGTTTMKVFCNDNTGFAVYAVGYSNEEHGNNKLLATVAGTLAPTYDIATGTATSGDTSNWAMKITSVPGDYSPTIENGYSNYSNVPSGWTKIATYTTNTDFTIGSSLKSTYAAYIDGLKPAGTYTGKVKYTLVHPNDAPTPQAPVVTNPGYISYNPNAAGVTDTMGDQALTNTQTSADLWASNFKREGYGFAGWNDKFDYTGRNFGPNETINFTAGQYSGDNKGLSLYAIWVPSAGDLQDWTGCSSLQQGDVTALTDARDNNTYAVAKLADGNCWMIENLRLADKTSDNTPITLSSTNTNNPISTFTQLGASIDPTQTAWCTTSSSACYDQSMLFSGNTTNPANPMTASNESTPVYSYGNYYNWYSTTAGNGTYSFSTNNNSVASDICPAGWNLPKGGNKNNTTSSDFWKLGVAITGAEPANTSSQTYPYYTGTPEGPNASNKFRSYPNNFVYSGSVRGSSVSNRSTSGYYWSSTAYSTSFAYTLYFVSNSVYPGTRGGYAKYSGFMARCMVSGS